MDDNDKGILEKFTDTVKSVVETASTAAKDALKPDPDKVAATANEQVYVPEATDAAAIPPSLFTTRKRASPSKASTTKRVNKRVAKKVAAKKAAAKAPTKKSKKTAKKTTKTLATKKSKSANSSATKKSSKKTVAKKAAPKKSKKGKKSKRGRS
jgi:hypothetical protein